MKAKIKKRYFKDEYMFYIFTNPGTYQCTVRQLCTDNISNGAISTDFKTVTFEPAILISGILDEKPKLINKLTFNKDYQVALKNELLKPVDTL